MKKLQDIAAYSFIVCITILAIVSILGVWEFFEKDVISKSFQSIGLLALVAIIVIIAGRIIDSKHQVEFNNNTETTNPNPTIIPSKSNFTVLRHITLVTLIASVSLLALIGILAIWEVLSGEVTGKSLASIAIIAFASFIIVLTCMERENHKLLHHNGKTPWGKIIIGIIVLGWLIPWIIRML